MPSPIGHSLAGFCGFLAVRQRVAASQRVWLLIAAVTIANLADIDVVPGLVLGDPRMFHHQATHSLAAAAVFGLAVGALVTLGRGNGRRWGAWSGVFYASHVMLDFLVDDPSAPFGVPLLWPFWAAYLMSPVPLFRRFDYFAPSVGFVGSVLSASNVTTVLWEVALLGPVVALFWFLTRADCRRPAGVTGRDDN